ncbi:DMT family transporter [Candidatus Pelagibacter sp. HIMB1321]|uniref:DMT family transporter n=1 Tax=Candidatus Pelagibacter sp. HIMB1321 TaxID=1388755 RepID=UPI000A080384|nr:DMT family transporter [Candidatus Pelagibacter sp. HIMB1321]SMF73238.1 EamA-like transporter family protein [Candidatus Pelagibacter sp. HIMB1321]
MKKPLINNELLGIFYMILCQFSFATNDAMVKFIYQNFDEIFVLNQVIFIRGIFALFFIGIFLYFKNLLNFKIIFSSRQLSIRGVFEAFAAICFFIGVATLPFGMVYVLLSLAPIFMTAFGALFLNEKVRWKRWNAVILGFIGIIIVINPKELEFGYFFIFPLLSAILLSFRDMYTKNIKGNFHSLQIAFITCLVVTIFFGFLSLYKFFNFSLKEYLILFVASFFLSLGYIFSVATIKVALVSVTSTFRYSVILWGILYGYFYFGEIPNTNTYIGAVLIVISGLIIITRQKQLGKIK